jgi:hypothetical protein
MGISGNAASRLQQHKGQPWFDQIVRCWPSSNGGRRSWRGHDEQRRGRPGTAQAGTWISLEPGFVVHLNADLSVITVERDGVAMQ